MLSANLVVDCGGFPTKVNERLHAIVMFGTFVPVLERFLLILVLYVSFKQIRPIGFQDVLNQEIPENKEICTGAEWKTVDEGVQQEVMSPVTCQNLSVLGAANV